MSTCSVSVFALGICHERRHFETKHFKVPSFCVLPHSETSNLETRVVSCGLPRSRRLPRQIGAQLNSSVSSVFAMEDHCQNHRVCRLAFQTLHKLQYPANQGYWRRSFPNVQLEDVFGFFCPTRSSLEIQKDRTNLGCISFSLWPNSDRERTE